MKKDNYNNAKKCIHARRSSYHTDDYRCRCNINFAGVDEQYGNWQLYRYNPELENPMTVDSKDPTGDYQEFLKGEVRYTSLAQQFPDAAAKLFVQQEEDAKVRRESYKKMAGQA